MAGLNEPDDVDVSTEDTDDELSVAERDALVGGARDAFADDESNSCCD